MAPKDVTDLVQSYGVGNNRLDWRYPNLITASDRLSLLRATAPTYANAILLTETADMGLHLFNSEVRHGRDF